MADVVNAKIVEIAAPMVPDRERRWQVMFRGDDAFLVNYLVLEPGEEVSDTPPERIMTRAEFRERCGEYGLKPDGQPLEE